MYNKEHQQPQAIGDGALPFFARTHTARNVNWKRFSANRRRFSFRLQQPNTATQQIVWNLVYCNILATLRRMVFRLHCFAQQQSAKRLIKRGNARNRACQWTRKESIATDCRSCDSDTQHTKQQHVKRGRPFAAASRQVRQQPARLAQVRDAQQPQKWRQCQTQARQKIQRKHSVKLAVGWRIQHRPRNSETRCRFAPTTALGVGRELKHHCISGGLFLALVVKVFGDKRIYRSHFSARPARLFIFFLSFCDSKERGDRRASRDFHRSKQGHKRRRFQRRIYCAQEASGALAQQRQTCARFWRPQPLARAARLVCQIPRACRDTGLSQIDAFSG